MFFNGTAIAGGVLVHAPVARNASMMMMKEIGVLFIRFLFICLVIPPDKTFEQDVDYQYMYC